jgi:ATP-dependent helicase/DNAse subunit B
MLDHRSMSLKLIHGPPNSGRAGIVRHALIAVLERDPVLVVPNADDVYSFERELCEERAVLGASVMTFGALFRTVVAAAGAPPEAELTPAQRLGAVSAAVAEHSTDLGPLRRSAGRPGFARAFARLLDDLQESALEAADVEAAAGTLEGSAYLADVAALFGAYAGVRDELGAVDSFGIQREAIRLLEESGDHWRRRPVFLYGLDDLTPNQLDLIRALAGITDVTVAVPYEEGNLALAARPTLLESLREIGVESELATTADPGNTPSPLLFHLERSFGAPEPSRMAPDGSLTFLRSAGERGEAEAIGGEVAELIQGGADPSEIAIVLRDPARRGPLIASVLESYGVPVALEAVVPVSSTAVGGGLMAMLETIVGAGRAADLLRYLRLAGATSPGVVDGFEAELRRGRIQDASTALALWEERFGDPPADLARARELAADPAALAAEVARTAAVIAARGSDLEREAAGAIASALSERAGLGGLAPVPEALARVLGELEIRVWRGPPEGRVRIADPYRLRAARFDHVIVGSLQDGEFPRRDGRADPFLSESQRAALGLQPRQDTDAEERYLFAACLALPRRRLILSYRDSDENGAAEARSPLLDQVRRLLDPPAPVAGEPDLLEEALTRWRDLAQVVSRLGEAPSEGELARAIAARGPQADVEQLLGVAATSADAAARVAGRLRRAGAAAAATRAPGPLRNQAVLESLGSVFAYGGTTLEEFDLCSYRWFVSHQLDPQELEPDPDPLAQGGLMHEALFRLYTERPGGDAQPHPDTLEAWRARGAELVRAIAAEREIGAHPSERAMVRRVEALLGRFLGEESERSGSPFEPWLLEAGFGEEEGRDRPALETGDWGLHGAIDRVDRAPDGRALVLDYKLSTSVTPLKKLEERAKLQLQLYLIAVAELWGAETVGGLYHPLRGTSSRSPRGAVLRDAAGELPYRLTGTDLLDEDDYEQLLADSRERAGQIVARMRTGDIRRDPGPREGLRGHGICPTFCEFAPICRRDRAPDEPRDDEDDEW